MHATADSCAHEVLETIPLIMRFIRSHMRSHRIAGLSVPQFRVLVFVSRCRGSSLSAVAEYVGISLPSVSRMADSLVKRGLLVRQIRAEDRRGVSLSVTSRGEKAIAAARHETQAELAHQLGALDAGQQEMIARAMRKLQPVFGGNLSGRAPCSR